MRATRSRRKASDLEQYNGDPRNLAANSERAIGFSDCQSFLKALGLLEELSLTEPVEHDAISNEDIFAIVMPARFFHRTVSFLESHGVVSQEMKVASISDLPMKKQARLRGLIR